MKKIILSADLEYAIAIWNLPSVFWLFEHRAPGYNSLSDILGAEWFDAKRRLQVARDTAKRMCQLHNLRFVLDRFTADDVFVQNAEKVSGSSSCKDKNKVQIFRELWEGINIPDKKRYAYSRTLYIFWIWVKYSAILF